MKKLLLLASLLAAVAIAGCGSEEPASAPSKAPEAAPAQKVEQKQNGEKPGVIKGTPIKGNGRSMGHF